jgi:putative nucleotidyltransferase with HDIG domain
MGRKATGLSPGGYGGRAAEKGFPFADRHGRSRKTPSRLFRGYPRFVQDNSVYLPAKIDHGEKAGKMIRELSNHEINALHYELLMKDIIAAAEKLPPFPDVAWKVMSLIKQMAPIKKIEEAVKFDQAITAKILSLGRSVYYGRRYEVHSLQDAILLLGNKRLVQILITTCASRYFDKRGTCQADERELWEHSVASALMSEIVSRRFNQKKNLTIYTASLLHDVGKTVLNMYARIYLHSSLSQWRGEGGFVDGERRALGLDHQELGGIIARNWKFPPEITAAIENHHNPQKAGQYQDIASLVYVANELVTSFARKKDDPRLKGIDPNSDRIFRDLGITEMMIDGFQAELEKNMEDVIRMLVG